MELKSCFLGLGVALVAVSMFASSAFEWMYANVLATEVVGDYEDIPELLSLAELREQDAFENQRYLVVGGTKGIGRGIALALAGAGASVDIVGRSGGDAVVQKMQAAANNGGTSDNTQFNFFRGDVSSFEGCLKVVEYIVDDRFNKLNETHAKQIEENPEIMSDDLETFEENQYNGVVFTVGVWPDSTQPLSPDGFDRVAFIDIIARYAVWRGLLGSRLIQYGSKVMSVLASGHRAPNTPELVQAIKDKFRKYETPEEKKAFSTSVAQVPTMAPVGDLLLKLIRGESPDMTVIGTYPGLIPTTLADVTFGRFGASLMWTIAKALRLTLTEEESGLRHANIFNNIVGGFSLVDHNMVQRQEPEVLENMDLYEWLKEWINPITEDVLFGGAKRVAKHREFLAAFDD